MGTDLGPLDIPPRPAPPRAFGLAARLTTALCWSYAMAISAVFLLMRLAGERWWVATLLLFSPRWIWIAPLAVLIPLAWIFRRRMVLPGVLAVIIVLFGVMDFRVPWRATFPHRPARQSIGILTCNIHNIQSDPQIINAFVDEVHPDVILMQDYTWERQPTIVKAEGWHFDQYEGLFIASRFPFHRIEDLLPRDETSLAYARQGWPLGEAACYAIDLPGGTVHLTNVHLASPHRMLDKMRRSPMAGAAPLQGNSDRSGMESLVVSLRLRQMGGPQLIAGDFNTPDDSPLFERAWREFHDAFSTAGFGFGTTYAKHHTWVRIDHILYDPGWRCGQCRVGRDVGSGHHPVFARFER